MQACLFTVYSFVSIRITDEGDSNTCKIFNVLDEYYQLNSGSSNNLLSMNVFSLLSTPICWFLDFFICIFV